jgi:hypothetical protein
MRKRGNAIFVDIFPSSGYMTRSHTILLSRDEVLETDAPTLGSIIVHEATHARIDHWGIPAHRDILGRIERRCLRQQIEFLKALPGTESMVCHYSQLENDDWWMPDRQHARRLEYYRKLGTPRWALRTYAFFVGVPFRD